MLGFAKRIQALDGALQIAVLWNYPDENLPSIPSIFAIRAVLRAWHTVS
jgi:hypothetical protein